MTSSPTAAEMAALKVARAATNTCDASYDLVSAIVFALGSAGLLRSLESATELVRLRARISELERTAADEAAPLATLGGGQ